MLLNRIINLGRRSRRKSYYKKRLRRQVYVTWDPVLRRRVVVKRYRDIAEARHERDVMSVYPVSRHLVRLHRFVADARFGKIVMEWVRGMTVAQLIARHGPLPEDRVRAIALDVLAGLRVLHRSGFLHGDLHSPNVIVTDISRARTILIDFQHAVPLRPDGTAWARRTVVPRPLKFGPECSAHIIDPAFDTYGVGFMCASMLLGVEPVTQEQLFTSRLRDSTLWPVIERALRSHPSDRYRCAATMYEALQSIR